MMTFDITLQQLKCGRCDRTASIEEADQREARYAGSSFSVDLLTCPTCGAEIRTMNTAAAAFCSYCGSSVMLEKANDSFIPPEEIAPFQITRDQCFEKYKHILKRSLCVDHRLKKNVTAESFRGIYVPYSVYQGSIQGEATLKGHQTKGDTTYYYDTKVQLNHQFRGILHDASKEMPDALSERISKVDRNVFRPFSPAYLSGYYADIPDTDTDQYIPYAKAEVVRNGLTEVMNTLQDGCTYSTLPAQKELLKVAEASYTGQTMIPVWFMSTRSGKRVLYAVQNGVTGEMAADIPLDIPRFALFAFILAIPLYFIFNAFLTLRPEMVLMLAMLLAIGAQLVVNGHRKKIFQKENENRTSDGTYDIDTHLKELNQRVRRQKIRSGSGVFESVLGTIGGIGGIAVTGAALYMLSLMGSESPALFKFGSVALTVLMGILLFIGRGKSAKLPLGSISAFLAMIAGSLLMIVNPFLSADLPVYLVTFACMGAVVWESLDMLLLYNQECSNPLPQFSTHQGGEDHA